jgi:Zn-dependent protease
LRVGKLEQRHFENGKTMFNSWDIGKVSGIKLRVHWTFFLLPIWIYFSSIFAGSSFAAAATSVLFVFAIFGCVLLHELGHALAARQFGIGTRDITLLPIGGIAALDRIPRNPAQELWIAVAGPLVNVVIAAVLFGAMVLSLIPPESAVALFLGQLLFANIALVVFNMIPAFPMDGGRVLRSSLAMFMEYAKATRIATSVGQACAIALGLLGLFSGNVMLMIIAGFIFLSARAENMYASYESGASRFGNQTGFPIQNEADVSNSFNGMWYTDEEAVPASLSVRSVADWLTNQRRESCSVVDSGRIIGKISRSQLIVAIYRGMGRVPVGKLVLS